MNRIKNLIADKSTPHRCQSDCDLRPARRQLLLGLGAAAVGSLTLAKASHAAGGTEALVLSCMDFRLMDDIERYMANRGLRDKYDHVVLAGASLGALTTRFPAWNKTFWQHLELAVKLHSIRRVLVIDHRDCGAYKVIVGEEHTRTPETEKRAHASQLLELRRLIGKRYPKLQVEILLMNLDGTVEEVRE